MTNTVNNRVDLELRSSIDQYIEHIKKTFKDSLYSTGSWDEDKVNQFCESVRVSQRGDLITLAAKNKPHSYIATRNTNDFEKGSIFGKSWLGKPALGSPIGNVLQMH